MNKSNYQALMQENLNRLIALGLVEFTEDYKTFYLTDKYLFLRQQSIKAIEELKLNGSYYLLGLNKFKANNLINIFVLIKTYNLKLSELDGYEDKIANLNVTLKIIISCIK